VTCPADPGKLSPEELKRLPSECSPLVEQNLMPWLSTGAAALITALAVVELNDDDDHHHRNNSPLPPTPLMMNQTTLQFPQLLAEMR
ncbi:hypothetical protein CMV42_21310, partial [Escherichia coli]